MTVQIRQCALLNFSNKPAKESAVIIIEGDKIKDVITAFTEWANKEKRKIINITGAYSRKYKIAALYLPQESDSGPELQCDVTAKDGDFDRALWHHHLWLARNSDKMIVKDITFLSFSYTTIAFFKDSYAGI